MPQKKKLKLVPGQSVLSFGPFGICKNAYGLPCSLNVREVTPDGALKTRNEVKLLVWFK